MDTKVVIGIIVVVVIAIIAYYMLIYKPAQDKKVHKKVISRVVSASKKRDKPSELNAMVYFDNGTITRVSYSGKIREKIIDVLISSSAEPSEDADSVWDISELVKVNDERAVRKVIFAGGEINALAEIEPESADGEFEARVATVNRIDESAVLNKVTLIFE